MTLRKEILKTSVSIKTANPGTCWGWLYKIAPGGRGLCLRVITIASFYWPFPECQAFCFLCPSSFPATRWGRSVLLSSPSYVVRGWKLRPGRRGCHTCSFRATVALGSEWWRVPEQLGRLAGRGSQRLSDVLGQAVKCRNCAPSCAAVCPLRPPPGGLLGWFAWRKEGKLPFWNVEPRGLGLSLGSTSYWLYCFY